jgi:putative ATP-dependent endonuclease of the OLD family
MKLEQITVSNFRNARAVTIACGSCRRRLHGKDSIDRLYRVFNELGIPCFVVMDYDDGGSADAVSSSKQLLDWLGQPSGVPNGILLTDKVACFQKDWEQMCAAETADYEALKQQARKQLGVKADNGKPLIARYIARVLVGRNPAVVPATISAVLSKAVGCKHSGSCLRKPD